MPGFERHNFANPAVTTAPQRLVNPGQARAAVIMQNQGSADIYFGDSTVTAAAGGGFVLKGGLTPPATFTDTTTNAEWWFVVAAGTSAGLVLDVII